MAVDSSLPGLDLDRLAGHLRNALDLTALGPLHAELIAGGRSNLTYRVTDGAQEWIVRRPPLGTVPRGSHDVVREFTLMTALTGTPIPVPQPHLLCTDTSVLGAPFIVTSLVHGRTLRSKDDLAALGPERTRDIVLGLVDVLARLHAIAPASVGLEAFGRPEGFLDRQVRRWKKQLDQTVTREIPGLEELHAGLAATRPQESDATILHGDYRLDNVLIDEHDAICAVLDWEMSTVGDPLTDLALLVARNRDVVGDEGMMFDGNAAPGHPSTAEMVARYAERSDRDVSGLDWYIALAHFKRAAAIEGIRRREQRADDDATASLTDVAVTVGLAALRRFSEAGAPLS